MGNLGMYIFSMPMYEAKELAGYPRYFDSIKIYSYLLLIGFFIEKYIDIKISYKLVILVVVAMYSVFNFNMYREFVSPVDVLTKRCVLYGIEDNFYKYLHRKGMRIPEDTMNKKIAIVSKEDYDYTNYMMYKYVTLSADIEIVKKEQLKDRMKYDYVLEYDIK